ncbi:FAD-binding oxidoreductase, partial [Haladaptatus sp. NG-SE-30]
MTQTTITSREGSTTTLSGETIEAFSQRVRGALLFPSDSGFEEATRLWNGMIEKTPALVVQPTGTADIVAAVDFAREHDLALSVKGGGHNIAGTALVDGGLTIDMAQLRGVLV